MAYERISPHSIFCHAALQSLRPRIRINFLPPMLFPAMPKHKFGMLRYEPSPSVSDPAHLVEGILYVLFNVGRVFFGGVEVYFG